MTDLSDLVADDSLGESESNDTIVSLVSEGRRLLGEATPGPWGVIGDGETLVCAEPVASGGDPFELAERFYYRDDAICVAWSRNNLPALLDEAEKAEALAEKVPTLEAEVERLQAENADRDAYDRANLTAVAATVAHKDAEIARLRADRDRCKAAAISIEHDVCHVIGEALYGPDGWGDHVAQTLAQKAVNEIARLRAENERLRAALKEIACGKRWRRS